jgi:hypothetical protein
MIIYDLHKKLHHVFAEGKKNKLISKKELLKDKKR